MVRSRLQKLFKIISKGWMDWKSRQGWWFANLKAGQLMVGQKCWLSFDWTSTMDVPLIFDYELKLLINENPFLVDFRKSQLNGKLTGAEHCSHLERIILQTLTTNCVVYIFTKSNSNSNRII